MKNYGFTTVAAAVPAMKLADTHYNSCEIVEMIKKADAGSAEIVCLPELCITGYSCQDLFRSRTLLDNAKDALEYILEQTGTLDIIAIVGMPLEVGDMLLNCAIVIQHGKVMGVVAKTYLPDYNEFYEKRWFVSACDFNPTRIFIANEYIEVSNEPQIFVTSSGVRFGVEICEDIWAPTPPSNNLTTAGAEIVFNISASNSLAGKYAYLKSLISQQSARTICGYVYASSGFGESTQDVVFSGNALIYENGKLIASGERFSLEPQLVINQIDVERLRAERRNNTTFTTACRNGHARLVQMDDVKESDFCILRQINPLPFVPTLDEIIEGCDEIINIQTSALARRLVHTNCKTIIIGISGGLDSTLALLVCVKTFDRLGFDRKGIIGVTMPGFGTSNRTHNNASDLMESFGITSLDINIAKSVTQHLEDIGHDINDHNVTYENAQARERTQILMDLSNKYGGMVLGTGTLSELALGWCTYNGDHMSMYAVNASIPKTLIRHLIRRFADIFDNEKIRETLLDIIDTPISPELLPTNTDGKIAQKTEDIVGPYELHDFFLYYFVRFGFRPEKIYMLACAAFGEKSVNSEERQIARRLSGAEPIKYNDKTIKYWLTTFFRRFFNQQFKRSCLPDGPKVGSISLSPRGDWRMPSDAASVIWLKGCESIECE